MMNPTVLFIGGLFLGIVLSLSILQHWTASPQISTSKPSSTSTTIPFETNDVNNSTLLSISTISNTISTLVKEQIVGSSTTSTSTVSSPAVSTPSTTTSSTTPASTTPSSTSSSTPPTVSGVTNFLRSSSGDIPSSGGTTAVASSSSTTSTSTSTSTSSSSSADAGTVGGVVVGGGNYFNQIRASIPRWSPGKETNTLLEKYKKEAENAQSHILGRDGVDKLGTTTGTTSSTSSSPTFPSPVSTKSVGITSLDSKTILMKLLVKDGSATDLIIQDAITNPSSPIALQLNEKLIKKIRRKEQQLKQQYHDQGSMIDNEGIKKKLMEILEKRSNLLQGKESTSSGVESVPASTNSVASASSPSQPATSSTTGGNVAENGEFTPFRVESIIPTPSYYLANTKNPHVTVVGQTRGTSAISPKDAKTIPPSSTAGKAKKAPPVSHSKQGKVGKPLIPYHDQVSLSFEEYSPYIPVYSDISGSISSQDKLPNMSKQRGEYEKENLKLHLCNGVFEAYSASYLTTKQHMINVGSENFNLSWVNCEMASFIHMKESNKFYKNPNNDGVIVQSLDVLDFSAIHLSAFERSSKKHKDVIWASEPPKIRNTKWSNIDPVIEAGKKLQQLNDPNVRKRNIQYSEEAKRTVVIMPFLGGAMGAGHSELGNRFEYLKTCFWSLYEFFPYITASVSRQEDVEWAIQSSGLPFYDIMLIEGLPKSAGLPVATTQHTKARFLSGQWSHFDYIFFTESDQIIISRELPLMYEHLKKFPGHMILPHRLMPYSKDAMTLAHKRSVEKFVYNEWMEQSCCLERQNCIERKSWKHVKDEDVPVINYYGLYVPLGNINFLREDYRYCKLSSYVGDYCP